MAPVLCAGRCFHQWDFCMHFFITFVTSTALRDCRRLLPIDLRAVSLKLLFVILVRWLGSYSTLPRNWISPGKINHVLLMDTKRSKRLQKMNSIRQQLHFSFLGCTNRHIDNIILSVHCWSIFPFIALLLYIYIFLPSSLRCSTAPPSPPPPWGHILRAFRSCSILKWKACVSVL